MVLPGIEKDLVLVVAVLKAMHLLNDSMVGRHRPIGLRLVLSVGTATNPTIVDAFVVAKGLDLMRFECDGGVQVASFDAGPHHIFKERSVASQVVGAHF